MTKGVIVYIDTRALDIERSAEIKAAKATDIPLVIVTSNIDAYAQYEDIFLIVEAQVTNIDAVLDIIGRVFENKKLHPLACVAWTDPAVETCAAVNEHYHLRGMRLDVARRVRNKAAMRAALEIVPGANPSYAVVTDEDSFLEAVSKIGVPCLIKPAGASGGRGIFKIDNTNSALDTYREFRNYCQPERDQIYQHYAERCLVESCLQGSEHSVAGMVIGGEVNILAISDKLVDLNLPLIFQTKIPSDLNETTQKEVVRVVTRAVKALGIDQSGFHADIILDEHGPKILEIGGRLGGDTINSHLLSIACPEINSYEILLEMLLGRNIEKKKFSFTPKRQAAMRLILPSSIGLLDSVKGWDVLQEASEVVLALSTRSKGETLYSPCERYNQYALGFFIAESPLNTNVQPVLDQLCELIEHQVIPAG